MKWLDNIKRWFGEKALQSRLGKERSVEVKNFRNAKSIGLIYREKGEGFYILVKQYVKYLKAEHGIREVLAMSYIDEKKQVPHYHLHRLKFDYFTRGDLSWKLEPNCDQVRKFANREFDILIDLERKPVLPLQFVLADSKALLKVGYYQKGREDYYDLMIDVRKDATFDEYIQQVNHYLNSINRENARA